MTAEELAALGKAMATQDNQCTAHPMFLVQQRERLFGFDPVWGGSVAWLRDGEEVDPEEFSTLEATFDETGHEPESCYRTGYVDQWEFVTCCFTEAAAKAYLEANRHRLTEPRIYVESAHRNHEFIAVREHLLAAAPEL